MRALSVSLLLLALPLAPLLAPPAVASPPLVADAGETQVAWDGATLALGARAFGGAPPYAFAWSHAGSAARFGDAASATSSFSTAGLADGDVVLDLEVTDATGATATDTVRMRLTSRATFLERSGPLSASVWPVVDVVLVPLDLPVGTLEVRATLDWTDPVNDLDVYILDPNGNAVDASAGATSAKPESVTVPSPSAERWYAEVRGFLNAPDSFTLKVETVHDGDVPVVSPLDKYRWGRLDAQQLLAHTRGGVAPTIAWDLDLDGVYETPGEDPVAAFPVDDVPRVVAIKMADARGYEARRETTVTPLTTADRVLRLGCGGFHDRPYGAMEFGASGGKCFVHGGHNTYFLGGPAYTLVDGKGRVVSVEQRYSPPTELVGVRGRVHVEASLDGRDWTEVAALGFNLLGPDRQALDFSTLPEGETPFRFLRFAQPKSAEGLSGFMDLSYAELLVDAADVAEPDASFVGTRALSCATGDVFEDFFAEHPCVFGGVNRYDSASYVHTYQAGSGAVVDRVAGSFRVLPWRTDDFFLERDENETLVANASALGGTTVEVQVSQDGYAWTTVATVPAPFGPDVAFDETLAHEAPARFVRLLTGAHPEFDNGLEPALHHRLGFFADSAVLLDGRFTG